MSGLSLGYLVGDHFTLDYRRAARGLANLDRVQGRVELKLSSVLDSRGRRFQVLRQGELVVWRAAEPSGPPTAADAEQLAAWVDGQYHEARVHVTLGN